MYKEDKDGKKIRIIRTFRNVGNFNFKRNSDVPYFILLFSVAYCKQTQSVIHETMKNYQV